MHPIKGTHTQLKNTPTPNQVKGSVQSINQSINQSIKQQSKAEPLGQQASSFPSSSLQKEEGRAVAPLLSQRTR
jgi:hypothetical protein